MQTEAPPQRYYEHGVHATGTVTIMRSAADLYSAWRSFTDLPRFIDHLKSVQPVGGAANNRWHWVTRGPAGREYEWDAQLINDVPNQLIAWKSVGDADIQTAGSIRFRELFRNRGTRVDVALEYVPPGNKLGDTIAKVTGDDAKTQVREALYRFRQVMETGEVANVKGQSVGAGRKDGQDDQRETESDLRDIAGMEW